MHSHLRIVIETDGRSERRHPCFLPALTLSTEIIRPSMRLVNEHILKTKKHSWMLDQFPLIASFYMDYTLKKNKRIK